ncbi:DUF7344 domain-containing protein [Haladaptatus salinisoli]|uniref:DUF7344 domain-containing protein n=1 Tax=Haladaptatus salinisoli TaxID=2884876 RepID=UPI001D0A4651|nr:hypothetical protein [Haladaptatus salinisoli]
MSVESDSATTGGFGSTEAERPEPLSRDKIFHILQTQRRRDALRYLKDTDGPVEMRDIAEQVAAWENDTTVQALTSDERQRVYIALYQSHLPKLDSEGIIEYQKSRGIVERGPLADQFDPYLDLHGEGATETKRGDESEVGDEVPWFSYYRRITTVGVLTAAAAWLGVPPISLVPDLVWGVILVAAFAAVSVAQLLANET